jgi:hydrogenase maturation factor
MTDKEKAKELASLLVGEDQNPQPLIDVLLDMAKWKETQVKKSAKTQHVDKTCKENGNSLTQELVSESIDFEQELYKAFGQINDFTLGVAIAKRFYDMGRKQTDQGV